MIAFARTALVYAFGSAAVVGAIYAAATFALDRDNLLTIDAATASRLSVDYSEDEQPPVLAPLDPGIIAEIVEDEEQLPPLPGAPQPSTSAPQATATPSAGSASSPTPVPGAIQDGLSQTPLPRPSETPRPQPTDTRVPAPTDTPQTQPSATHTPEVKPTETAEPPKPTDTPTPTRTPRRCPIIDLPPALDGLYENCLTHTPTPVKTPTPTRTPFSLPTIKPLPDIEDILDCALNPSTC
jgi:hypothetical protein